MGVSPDMDSVSDICSNLDMDRNYGMMEKAFGVALVLVLLLVLTMGDRY